MSTPATELERAIAAFRREQATSYLSQLVGQPPEGRARARLASERALELLDAARDELGDAQRAATCAHLARATFELHYQRARLATSTLPRREVSVEGETRSLEALLAEWLGLSQSGARERVLRSMAPSLEQYADAMIDWRNDADEHVGTLLGRLRPARHPDAGPEGGAREQAARWLEATRELTQEALAFAARAHQRDLETGFDAIWIALGQDMRGLFPREGRLRRLSAEWEPLGMRQLLAARAKAAPEHPGPFVAPHLVVLEQPTQLRVSESERELGLASELTCAEVVGRALGLAHGASSLPLPLRFAPVATVARAIGGLAVQRLLDPRFLRRVRGLGAKESERVARLCALWFLVDARIAAAQVLARTVAGPTALDELAAIAERALLGSVQRGPAATLLVRASPGATFRARSHAPALVWSLRERFDEDWYLNPRSAEPLRGALARAGELSIEQLADELNVTTEHGVQKLAELF